ncbi:Diphthamide biosynthesis protein 2 [Diplonema papillatum]|nr:Diphthamide biosynthesis protein 2 [Diplonema papillatum]
MSALTDDGSSVVQRGMVAIHSKRRALTEAAVVDVYSIGSIAAEVLARGVQRVALQLPDEMLTDAVFLQKALRNQSPPNTLYFVMADTVFAPCCVDAVTAQHAGAELIIKFGHSCKTAVVGTPVFYVDPPLPAALDIQRLKSRSRDTAVDAAEEGVSLRIAASAATRLRGAFFSSEAKAESSRRVLVVGQPSMAVVESTTIRALQAEFPVEACNVSAAQEVCKQSVVAGKTDFDFLVSGKIVEQYRIPETVSPQPTDALLVLGCSEGVLTQAYLWRAYHVMRQSVQNTTEDAAEAALLLVFDENGNEYDVAACPVSKRVDAKLRARCYTIEKIKDAEVIAIVVCALLTEASTAAVERLKSVIRSAGKQVVVVFVGKPNVPKLANYEEVDLYCIVACPQSTLFDSKEYPKPVVAPVEIMAALSTVAGEGDGDDVNVMTVPQYYSLDLPALLTGFSSTARAMEDDMSLVTGAIRPAFDNRPLTVPGNEAESTTESTCDGTVAAYTRRDLVLFEESPIVARLHARAFQGLDPQEGKPVQAEIKQGLSGIAQSYASEARAE